MFDIGFWEIVIIGVVALVVVGPERFPGMIKQAVYWVKKIRGIVASVKTEIVDEVDKADQLQNLLEEQKQIFKRHIEVDLTKPAVKSSPASEAESQVSRETEKMSLDELTSISTPAAAPFSETAPPQEAEPHEVKPSLDVTKRQENHDKTS